MEPTDSASHLFTPTEVAKRLKIRIGTLAEWRYRGQGPRFVKVGHLVRYPQAAVDEWLAERTQSPGA